MTAWIQAETLPAWARSRLGRRLRGYRIEAVIGQGSIGTVYSAHDLALDRRVALKVLTPELARDERFRERFLRESKLAASLEPAHRPDPLGRRGRRNLYLAMRYVDGSDLGVLLKGLGRLDAERTLSILEQVGHALDAAHARGLVHRSS